METAKRKITALLALILPALVLLGLLLPAQASASANSPGIILGGGAVTKGSVIVMAETNWDVVLNSTSTNSANGRLLMTSGNKSPNQSSTAYLEKMSYLDTSMTAILPTSKRLPS